MVIHRATKSDLHKLLPTLLELRPHLKSNMVRSQFEILISEGYQIRYIGDQKIAYSIIGYICLNFFFSGMTLYIDDLITNSNYRKKGYAGQLLDWILLYAKENNYDHISLDSGFARKDAYRLYLNKGLQVEALHFGRKVIEL